MRLGALSLVPCASLTAASPAARASSMVRVRISLLTRALTVAPVMSRSGAAASRRIAEASRAITSSACCRTSQRPASESSRHACTSVSRPKFSTCVSTPSARPAQSRQILASLSMARSRSAPAVGPLVVPRRPSAPISSSMDAVAPRSRVISVISLRKVVSCVASFATSAACCSARAVPRHCSMSARTRSCTAALAATPARAISPFCGISP